MVVGVRNNETSLCYIFAKSWIIDILQTSNRVKNRNITTLWSHPLCWAMRRWQISKEIKPKHGGRQHLHFWSPVFICVRERSLMVGSPDAGRQASMSLFPNAAWDNFSSPYWVETEQAQVSYWQTLTLVWNDFAIAYFHIQYSLTFCKWQLVINWHHGSIKAGCVHPAASKELKWKWKNVFSPEQNSTEMHAVSQAVIFFKITQHKHKKAWFPVLSIF